MQMLHPQTQLWFIVSKHLLGAPPVLERSCGFQAGFKLRMVYFDAFGYECGKQNQWMTLFSVLHMLPFSGSTLGIQA